MPFDKEEALRLGFLFLASYALLFVLGIVTPLPEWEFGKDVFNANYLHWLLPIAGFFFLYYLVDWIDSFFGKDAGKSLAVPLLLIVLGAGAYYIQLHWYLANIAELAGQDKIPFDFFEEFMGSTYIYFLLSGLLGWVSRIIMEKTKR